MKTHSRLASALAAGGSFHGLAAAPRADASNPKAVIEALQKNWDEFQAANDERLNGIDKKFDDVVTNDKVDKINASIETLTATLDEMAKRNAQLELGGTEAGAELAANAKAFGRTVGSDEPMNAEEYSQYKDSMDAYMRKGDAKIGRDAMALMEVGSDPEGGYTVPTEMSSRIVKRVFETSDMRAVASSVTIGTADMEGFHDGEEASSGWVGEKQSRPETDTPGLSKWKIEVHEQYAQPKVTQKLLDDSAWDIEGWLSDKVADKFAREENTAFLTGNSELRPRGLLTYPTDLNADDARAWGTFQHLISGANTSITNTDFLIDLVFSIKGVYRRNANWFMNRKSVSEIRKLKDGDGNYLWQPDFEQRQGGNLLGYGIVEMEDMPDMVANALAVAFGDMRETYTIVDRTGIRVLRDPFTEKGMIKLYTTKRVGGDVLDFDTMKFMKFTA